MQTASQRHSGPRGTPVPRTVPAVAPVFDPRGERDRLVRLCARLSGAPGAAEDLAQEVLAEAVRSGHRLRDPDAVSAWLNGIARNVCLRWRRAVGTQPQPSTVVGAGEDPIAQLADGFDFERELDRRELAGLLDRALGLLPPATRAALVLRYVQEAPHAEIAGRLALSEGAVAMRLQRGRLAVRRLLAEELRTEAAAFGLAPIDGETGWTETRLWCPICGGRRLEARYTGGRTEFWLRCPGCHAPHGISGWHNQLRALPPWVRGVGHAGVLAAALEQTHQRYEAALRGEPVACWRCGGRTELRQETTPHAPPPFHEAPSVRLACASCGATSSSQVAGLVLAHPAGRRFWREQGRVRARPDQVVSAGERPAYRTVVESVGSAARLEVLTDRDSLRLLRVDAKGVR
jgi:RNA polymerase sigma factor (sigma-70 family)